MMVLNEVAPATRERPGAWPTPQEGADVPNRTCSIDGCEKPHWGRGWCAMHWTRWKRHGDPLYVSHPGWDGHPLPTLLARTEVQPNGCWRWTGYINPSGYGQIGHKRPHVLIYERMVGPVPAGLELDHLCHTQDSSCPGGKSCPHRACVNPAHLEPVTGAENRLRARSPVAENARKTHCIRGHEFTPENTYVPPKKPNARHCRTCEAEVQRIRRGSAT